MRWTGNYFYPPRPKGNISPGSPQFRLMCEDSRWVAQAKVNGQNLLIWIADGEISLWTRHKTLVKNYEMGKEQEKFLVSLSKKWGPLVLNGELIDKKTKDFKGLIYIWDVLVVQGQYLLNTPYAYRLDILKKIAPKRVSAMLEFAEAVVPGVWVAKTFDAESWPRLLERYKSMSLFEGLVLKNLNGKLEPGFGPENNGGWSVRCRKMTSTRREV